MAATTIKAAGCEHTRAHASTHEHTRAHASTREHRAHASTCEHTRAHASTREHTRAHTSRTSTHARRQFHSHVCAFIGKLCCQELTDAVTIELLVTAWAHAAEETHTNRSATHERDCHVSC